MNLVRRLLTTPELSVPIAGLAAGAILLGIAIVALRPDSQVTAALIAAVAAGYPPVVSLLVTRHVERTKEAGLRLLEVEREARAKKVPEYEKFVGFLMNMFFAQKLGKKPMAEQQMIAEMLAWTKPLLIWGSDDVVRLWGRIRIDAAGGGTESLFRLEELLFAIRRDVGYPATTLRRGDILRLWVNDIDKHV